MRFPPIPYMQWIKTESGLGQEGVLDFATSGLIPPARRFSELGLDTSELPLTGGAGYGYTPTLEALAQRYDVPVDSVLLAQGTSMANFLMMAVLIHPGDTFLVETPVYECLSYPPASLGAKVETFERREEEQWRLNVPRVLKRAEETGAKIVLLSNPHNPGAVFEEDETILELADGLGDRWLIVDEVYRELLPGQNRQTIAGKRPNIIVTTSLTKTWGFGHLRAGWAIAPPEIVKAASRAYDHMGVNQPFPTDWLFAQLATKENLLDHLRDEAHTMVKASRELVVEFLGSETGHRIETVMPEFSGYATWRLEALDGDTVLRRLREEAGVVICPGSFFGIPEHFRVAWTHGVEPTRESLKRIGEWLEGV